MKDSSSLNVEYYNKDGIVSNSAISQIQKIVHADGTFVAHCYEDARHISNSIKDTVVEKLDVDSSTWLIYKGLRI